MKKEFLVTWEGTHKPYPTEIDLFNTLLREYWDDFATINVKEIRKVKK